MALFHRNTLPHPMKKVSSTVLVGVQSQLSDGRLWEKTMMWLGKVHRMLPPLWHSSWCQPQQCCMCRKLTSTILRGVWKPGMTCRQLPNLLFIRQMHAAEYCCLEELMLRMWYVSGQNDASLELSYFLKYNTQALPFPSVTCVLPNTIKVGDWAQAPG